MVHNGGRGVEYPNLLLKTFSTTVILNKTMNKTTMTTKMTKQQIDSNKLSFWIWQQIRQQQQQLKQQNDSDNE